MNRGSKAALCMLLTLGLAACGRQTQPQQDGEQSVTMVEVTPPEAANTPEMREERPASVDNEKLAQAQAIFDMLDDFTAERMQDDGQWAVAVQCAGEASCQSSNSRPMQSASLIKLFVSAAVEENQQSLAVWEQYSGETDDLLLNMLSESDNEATNELVIRLGDGDALAGMEVVNQYCVANGYQDTSMGRLMLDFSSTADNYTSVKDCCAFLQAVLDGEVAGSDEILSALKQQVRTGKIPAGVPDGVVTANKTGELDTVENDVAIVWAEEQPYILCVMSNELSDTGAARAQITAFSEKVYAWTANDKKER